MIPSRWSHPRTCTTDLPDAPRISVRHPGNSHPALQGFIYQRTRPIALPGHGHSRTIKYLIMCQKMRGWTMVFSTWLGLAQRLGICPLWRVVYVTVRCQRKARVANHHRLDRLPKYRREPTREPEPRQEVAKADPAMSKGSEDPWMHSWCGLKLKEKGWQTKIPICTMLTSAKC